MTTRRSFLKYTGSTLTLFGFDKLGIAEAIAAIPGGSLDPADVPKFRTPLLIPPVMPRAATLTMPGGKPVDYYEISMKQFSQQILPDGLPATTVWGYGAVSAASGRGLLLHHAPSLTIEAQWNRPVRIKWINDLKDGRGNYRPHLLPVDPTLHWANPPGGAHGRDSRPTFTSTPGRYTGPVPIVTHVHGALGVGDESDGYPEAWYLPAAKDIDPHYAREGTWYDFYAAKAADGYGAAWNRGFAVFQYGNLNRACTLWYHDHALGITRLNVYAGPAGFYLVRGGPAGDEAVLDSRTGRAALFPGPAPKENDPFPTSRSYCEIPIVIQDRSFNRDGSLFYPDSRAFFGDAGPYLPDTDLSPIWNPEFFANTLIANGNTWPFLSVERRRYRLRFLNGCQSRFLILDFSRIPGVEVWQIGNEGGFLPEPVNLTADNRNRLLLALAERADLIVDFRNVPPGNYVLANVGPDEPFGGGEPDVDFTPSDPESTGQVLQFRVGPARGGDPSTPPRFLQLPALVAPPPESVVRRLALVEIASAFVDSPAEAMLGTVQGNPGAGPALVTGRPWMDPVSENPKPGVAELWEIYNTTEDGHPIHVHATAFEVVSRQPIIVDEADQTVQLQPGSVARPADLWESGLKDTVVAYPGEVTRLRARFETPGQFVWHCHILEHEDNEMMRPFRVGPVQPGQPEMPASSGHTHPWRVHRHRRT